MKSEIENHSIFGKDVTYQVMDSSAWIVVREGRNYWAYTNDKRKCVNIIKNKVTNLVNVESVTSNDMVSLMNHFHCSVEDTENFKYDAIRSYNI